MIIGGIEEDFRTKEKWEKFNIKMYGYVEWQIWRFKQIWLKKKYQ